MYRDSLNRSWDMKETTFSSQVKSFEFSGEAIDTSLRRLLAEVKLPKETQQIGRVMEDFAKHYYECNPTLMDSPDIVFTIAFSILLLHTDIYNKNVKQKMNKKTFIMRTKLVEGGESIPAEILDIMYDNILASEFTYADKQQVSINKANSWLSKLMYSNTETSKPISLSNDLREKLEELMPSETTFNYKQTLKPIPIMQIYSSMLKAASVTLSGVKRKNSNNNTNSNTTIRAIKAGLVDIKYDLIQDENITQGWKPYGVILGNSQIILFADSPAFRSYLLSTNASSLQTISSPTAPSLRPVQIISLSQAVCIHDESSPHNIHLMTGDGQQILFKSSAEDMNDWMLKINYVATLKTTGIRTVLVNPKSSLSKQKRIGDWIQEMTHRINEQVRQLDYDLQLRRNLLVLMPLQKTTKDRMLVFANTIGKRIRSMHIELQRLRCYRDFLLECEWMCCRQQPAIPSSSSDTSSLSDSDYDDDDLNSLKSYKEEEQNCSITSKQFHLIDTRLPNHATGEAEVSFETEEDDASVVIVNFSHINKGDLP